MLPTKFTVRVYGLLEKNNSYLLSKELIRSETYYKFVGGGLEFGESISQALIREFKEELNVDIEIKEQLYITDTFVQSSFDSDCQVLCVYFSISITDEFGIHSFKQALDSSLDKKTSDQLVFWCPKEDLLNVLDLKTDIEFVKHCVL